MNLYYNKPTSRSCLQSILFHCRVTLHVLGAFHTHHQEYAQLYLQPPVQVILSLQLLSSNMATLEEGSCNNNMICTGGCRYSLAYSWWWVWKAPETCRVFSILSLQLPSSNVATLEEGSCNDNMTCTGGCRYSLAYSWWWVCKAPETCRVTLQWNKVDCEQLHASCWFIII